MIGPCFLAFLIAAALPADQRDAVGWIGQLNAEAFDDRVQACKALESLGSQALPALRAAADAPDGRVRVRVRALIESIARQAEADRFSRPTLIRLDFPDQPLSAIIDTLNARHDLGLELRIGPGSRGMRAFGQDLPNSPLQELKDRRVTLEADQPVPFWEAIDRICQAGALRATLPTDGPGGSRQGSVWLLSDRTDHGPAVDSGPFRVQMTALSSRFVRDFTLDPEALRRQTQQGSAGDLTIGLAILPEPDLAVRQSGALIIAEATDDQGRSLIPPSLPAFEPAHPRWPTPRSASTVLSIPLVVPEPPGSSIRRLRGRVPVVVVAHGVDPVVVPLQATGSVGKRFSTREITLVVDEVALTPSAPIAVKVTVRSQRDERSMGLRSGRDPAKDVAIDRDRIAERLELRDAAGHRLKVNSASQTRWTDPQGFYDSYRLVVAPVQVDVAAGEPRTPTTPLPVELRYYNLVQTTTEIPFDFRDIPMP